MKRIALLSDTHAHLDEKIFKHLEACDEIWHAGDIGNIETADRLAEIAPLVAVYGNADGQDVRQVHPLHQRFKCEEVDVWMTHIGGYPGRYHSGIKKKLQKEKPQLFISGHSHILKVMNDESLNLLHMNPGAAGIQGIHQRITFLRFKIEGNRIEDLEVFDAPRKRS
jgi:putative phosphoesterase